jgi:hypothetical protein
LGDERFGLVLPEDLESEENFLPGLGRTHPSVEAYPSGVAASSGALFVPERFKSPTDEAPFFDFRFLLCFSCVWFVGTNASEECDSRLDSCSNVFIASIRDAFERFRRAW